MQKMDKKDGVMREKRMKDINKLTLIHYIFFSIFFQFSFQLIKAFRKVK